MTILSFLEILILTHGTAAADLQQLFLTSNPLLDIEKCGFVSLLVGFHFYVFFPHSRRNSGRADGFDPSIHRNKLLCLKGSTIINVFIFGTLRGLTERLPVTGVEAVGAQG